VSGREVTRSTTTVSQDNTLIHCDSSPPLQTKGKGAHPRGGQAVAEKVSPSRTPTQTILKFKQGTEQAGNETSAHQRLKDETESTVEIEGRGGKFYPTKQQLKKYVTANISAETEDLNKARQRLIGGLSIPSHYKWLTHTYFKKVFDEREGGEEGT